MKNTITEEIFGELYNQFYPGIFRLCLSYVNGNSSIAEDLIHEVFLVVWDKRSTFRNESSASTWIYRITVNTCLMYLRKEKKLPLVFDEITTNISDEDELSEKETCKQLYDCISKLDEADKIFVMLLLEEITNNEIADILGISEINVRVKTHRLKNKLRKYFE